LIVMHNRRDYMDSLISLLKKHNVTDATVIERKRVGRDLVGEWTNFVYHSGEISAEYNKALVAVVEGEEKTKRILALIENDPGLRWLNLEDRGFVCAVPFQKVSHLELESPGPAEKGLEINMADHLSQERILLDMKARDKEGSIRELGGQLKDAHEVVDFDVFVADAIEREKIGTTGIGKGVAIPHARTDGVKSLVVAFGRSSEGVEFGSIDEQPARLIFLIGTPKERAIEHYLRVLAHLTRLLRKEPLRDALLQAKTAKMVKESLRKAENQRV
jgi:PTS system nitrogen regulatory IIA component